MEKLELTPKPGQKIYFASDFHLGATGKKSSLERELHIINWLESIKNDAYAIFLVGDIFDFWFEYKHVIPKGFIRFQHKLLELKTAGIHIYFFHGNHDMWMFDYFPDEFEIPVYPDPIQLNVFDKNIYIGHGDGLGPGDNFYKILKKIFRNRLCQWLFRWVHPDIGIGLANYWSSKSRISSNEKDDGFTGEKEWLFQYAKTIEEKKHYDLYIFGHRHMPLEMKINEASTYFNLGEWVFSKTYGVLNESGFNLLKYEEN